MTDLNRIVVAEEQLEQLLADCDHESLSHSLRRLALYVAFLKEQHGELDDRWIRQQLQTGCDSNPTTIRIIENSLQEAISMLSMVLDERQFPKSGQSFHWLN